METKEEAAPALNIHAILYDSRVNGPGRRMVIWTQGCQKACPGCFNPHTWTPESRALWTPHALAEEVRAQEPEGLTLTGGDPLEQPEALRIFLEALHDETGALPGLPAGILCFTGYTMAEIEQIPAAAACLRYLDVVIDGRYIKEERCHERLAGSANQRIWFSERPFRGRCRINANELESDQAVEVHVDQENRAQVTGFPAWEHARLRALGVRILR